MPEAVHFHAIEQAYLTSNLLHAIEPPACSSLGTREPTHNAVPVDAYPNAGALIKYTGLLAELLGLVPGLARGRDHGDERDGRVRVLDARHDLLLGRGVRVVVVGLRLEVL